MKYITDMRTVVFFKEMLNRADLSIGARVLWSWLISEAVLSCEGGTAGFESWLSDHGEVIKMSGVGFVTMPEEVGFSRATFHRKMYELKDAGIFVDGVLSCPLTLLRGGYFELKRDTRFVSVEERVMYSWLFDRAVWSSASIIWVSNPYMAKVLGMSVAMVRTHKTRMNSCGLLEVYHPRRGSYYTAIPALYKRFGHTVREYENKSRTIKVHFE